jgi:hypothetical protein
MAQRTRPEPILRFYVEGRAVSGPEFWEAVRRLGGRAVVETVDLAPRLTPKGEAALREGGK